MQLEKEDGIYMKLHCFADFANAAIRRADWNTLAKCYKVIDRALTEIPDDEVFNVICVSFIEHLQFGVHDENGVQAKKLMPLSISTEWKNLEIYWQKLGE